ncbi:TetR/AcrR family transcriptional regulator [Amycolatopsis sp. NPDC005232]|uniref:TetR/AcrR family transcriptional regulator n=1 Tax=Amycolatopsis sp. NPDC005232 TaxID=3157027 RepID=UPI00339E6EFB
MDDARTPRRDPDRKERILAVSADLISRHGYHAVGLAEIGAAAGIVSTGVYRHFPSKAAILTALLYRVMDLLDSAAAEILATTPDERTAVTELVRHHVRVAVEERRILQVYHLEARNLPAEDLRRLQRAQREYLEGWAAAVRPLRPGLAEGEARVLVHSAIGCVQSVLFHQSGLLADRLTELLRGAAHACLGVPPVEPEASG